MSSSHSNLSQLVGLLAAAFVLCAGITSASPVSPKEKCSCAAMNSTDPADLLVERGLTVNLPCNDVGEQLCSKLCITLANTTKEDPNGHEKFCHYYNKTGRLLVNVFSKICERPFKFTGVANQEPVCCQEGRTVACS